MAAPTSTAPEPPTPPRRGPAIVAGLLTLLALTAQAARLGWIGGLQTLDPASLQHNQGQAYTVAVAPGATSWPFAGADDGEHPRRSALVLLEDGSRLGPAHVSHAEIRARGGGRYSHWGGNLYFSTSDGSDPRHNGREYVLRRPPALRDPWTDVLSVLALLAVVLARPRWLLALPRVLLGRRPAPPSGSGVDGTPATGADDGPPRRRRPTRGGWRRRLVALAALALLAEGAAWTALTLQGRRAFAPGLAPHRLSPWRGHRLDPEYAAGLHANDGFREPAPIRVDKPAGSYRVMLLGGSSVYGLGAGAPYPEAPALDHDETLDHHLEQRLQERLDAAADGRRVEVVNCGVTGYETFQHLIHLNERLADYAPDLLLCVDGYNDWFRAREGRHPWRDYPYSSALQIEQLDQGSAATALWMVTRRWRPHSFVAEWLFEQLDGARRERSRREALRRRGLGRELPPERYGEYARRSFLRNYRQMAVVAEELGAGLQVVLQPAVYFEDRAALSPADQQRADITARFLEGRLRPAAEQQRLRDQLPALFAEADLDYLDCGAIATVPARGDPLYLDYVHLTGHGSEVLAERLADALWPRLADWLAAAPR